MPKTKDAFALRGLYNDLRTDPDQYFLVHSDDELSNDHFRIWLPQLEIYLSKRVPRKVDLEKRPRLKSKSRLYELGIVYNVEQIEISDRMKKFFDRIKTHVNKLQAYSAKLFDKILVVGLTDDLKHKADRAKNLIKCYQDIEEFCAGAAYMSERFASEREKEFDKSSRKLFGERLQQARQRKNLSILEMANQLKMSRTGYRYYELGQRDLPTPTICRIALFLDVSLDWLFGLTD